VRGGAVRGGDVRGDVRGARTAAHGVDEPPTPEQPTISAARKPTASEAPTPQPPTRAQAAAPAVAAASVAAAASKGDMMEKENAAKTPVRRGAARKGLSVA
jgi:hypothetical protein